MFCKNCTKKMYGAGEEQALRKKIKKATDDAIRRTIIDAFSRDLPLMSASDIAELISWNVMAVIRHRNEANSGE